MKKMFYFNLFYIFFYFNILKIDFTNCQEFNSTFPFNNTICKDTCRYGTCVNNTTCACNNYYITYNKNRPLKYYSQCNYKQVSKLNAFLFSFFLGPTAMDLLYMGYIDNAAAKLLSPLVIILISIIMFFIGKRKDKIKLIVASKICELIATITIFIWWMMDWISILNNSYTDFNGVRLYEDL